MKKKYVYIISLFLLLLDQVIKYIVVSNIELYSSIKVINNFFFITNVRNDGAGFSILSGHNLILILLTLMFIVFIYLFFIKGKKLTTFNSISYGVLFSGILGNLIDRVIHGYVIDYLDFYIFGYNYPVFNLADICIVVSIFMIIFSVIRGDVDANNSK